MDFPLFSSRPNTQKVVLRSPSPSPPPLAPAGRVIDEEEEDYDTAARRRAQIESVAVDSEDIIANSKITWKWHTRPSAHSVRILQVPDSLPPPCMAVLCSTDLQVTQPEEQPLHRNAHKLAQHRTHTPLSIEKSY